VNTRRRLKAAARWMIHEAVLDQISFARDEEQERKEGDRGKRPGESLGAIELQSMSNRKT